MSSESVKVCDTEIKGLADAAAARSSIDAIMARYLKCLEIAKNEAITSGEVHELLEMLYENAETIYSVSEGIGDSVSKTGNSFLGTIDDIDLTLYNMR